MVMKTYLTFLRLISLSISSVLTDRRSQHRSNFYNKVGKVIQKKAFLLFLAMVFSVGQSVADNFSEDFSGRTSVNSSITTANLSAEEGAVYLAWSRSQANRLPKGTVAGDEIGIEVDITESVVLGDVDGDGDLVRE